MSKRRADEMESQGRAKKLGGSCWRRSYRMWSGRVSWRDYVGHSNWRRWTRRWGAALAMQQTQPLAIQRIPTELPASPNVRPDDEDKANAPEDEVMSDLPATGEDEGSNDNRWQTPCGVDRRSGTGGTQLHKASAIPQKAQKPRTT